MQKLKGNHARELNRTNEQHQQEVNSLKRIIEKAKKWFPRIKVYLEMESLCRSVGFNEQQTNSLMNCETTRYADWLYSSEHRRRTTALDVSAEIRQDSKRNRFLFINE